MATRTIGAVPGIRFAPKLGQQIAANMVQFRGDHWKQLSDTLGVLRERPGAKVERAVAREVARRLVGIGPKQSRNFIQMLGLSQYEIPLDSRVASWLREFGFPLPVGAGVLADIQYYEFVLDAVQELCLRCGVLPCVLDACIFASADNGAWDNADSLPYAESSQNN